jgi:WD40 repeat protein
VQGVSLDHTLCVAKDSEHPDTLFDARTRRVIARLKAPERDEPGPRSGFFSPRANIYVMQDRTCDSKEVDTLFAIPSGKRLCQFSFGSHSGTASWTFSADESRVAFVERGTEMIRFHDTATGKLLWQRSVPEFAYVSLALSPNGNLLAVWIDGLRDVRIWDLRTGKHHRWLVLKQKAKDLDHACLAWSADSRMLAVGGLDESVRLWDVASGEVRREFRGHEARVYSLAFSRDGKLLASASNDSTLLIWKTSLGKERREDRKSGD